MGGAPAGGAALSSHSNSKPMRRNSSGIMKAEIPSALIDGAPETQRHEDGCNELRTVSDGHLHKPCYVNFQQCPCLFLPEWSVLCSWSVDPVAALSTAASCSYVISACCPLVTMAALSGPRDNS